MDSNSKIDTKIINYIQGYHDGLSKGMMVTQEYAIIRGVLIGVITTVLIIITYKMFKNIGRKTE